MLGNLGSSDYTGIHPYTERVAFMAFAYSLMYLIAQKDIRMTLPNQEEYLYLWYFCTSFYVFSKLASLVLLAAELGTTCL